MAVSQIALGAYFSSLAQYISTSGEHHTFCGDVSESGQNVSLAETSDTNHTKEIDSKASWSELHNISWLPLPLLMVFTVAFNLGLGSLTWVVATEILPVRSLDAK